MAAGSRRSCAPTVAAAAERAAALLPTEPDEIMITSGALHAVGLVARALLSRGDPAIVESPSYPHASDSLRHLGVRLVPVSVTTDEGWDTVAVAQAFQRTSPTLAYLMPDNHNPTGVSMSLQLRERTAALAAQQGTTIIADETMGELGFSDLSVDAPLSSQLAPQARNEGLMIPAGPRFGLDGVFERFLRVPFSPPLELIDRAVDSLAASWRAVTRHPLAVDHPGELADIV